MVARMRHRSQITFDARYSGDAVLRVLLCGPCNRRKRNYLTLAGLWRENKKKAVGWMKDESRVKLAREAARDKAQWARDRFHTPAGQELIEG